MTVSDLSYTRRAYYYETDQMGIIHHANHIRWFEEARLDFMKRSGLSYEEMEKDGILMPVTSVTCDYLIPIRFDEEVEIRTKLALFNGVRAGFHYEIYRKNDGKLLVTGESGHCFLDIQSWRPLNLKKCRPDLYAKTMRLLEKMEGAGEGEKI